MVGGASSLVGAQARQHTPFLLPEMIGSKLGGHAT